jgi:hypothetical protein
MCKDGNSYRALEELSVSNNARAMVLLWTSSYQRLLFFASTDSTGGQIQYEAAQKLGKDVPFESQMACPNRIRI